MFYDYHMHSNFSNDSKADMEDMIKRSIDLGLKEICFTDHVDYDLDSDDSFGIDYNKYFDKIQSLQNKYKDNIFLCTVTSYSIIFFTIQQIKEQFMALFYILMEVLYGRQYS